MWELEKVAKLLQKSQQHYHQLELHAFSISASDCSHGDLGRISKKDVLILISHSGSTEELKNIINFAKYK
jgi:D-arabinose 5-phosphate isomerase GutQ